VGLQLAVEDEKISC